MELGLPDDDPTVLHMDNQSTMAIAKNPQFHDQTKHIEVRHHFLRRKVEDGEIELEYIPTCYAAAGIFLAANVRRPLKPLRGNRQRLRVNQIDSSDI